MAKLHLDALARKAKYSKNAFLEAIDRLPKELDGTYHDALQRISNQETEDVELAMQVLCWVWQACEPLTLLQLQQVISIQQGHPNDERDHYIEPTLLVSVCAGLVVLSEEAQVVRLVHYTAVDYFQRHQSRYFPDSGIQVSFTCLSHLDKVLEMIDMKMWDGPDPSLPQDYFNAIVDFNKQDQEQHFGQNTFSRYAVLHMVEHLRHHLTKHQHPGLFKETKRLWVQSSKLHSLRKIYSHLRGVKYFMGKGDKGTLHALELFPEFSGLQLAVLFGLHSEVDRFLDLSRHSTIQSDSHQGQALCISAFYGDYRTLKQLLDAGTKLSYAYEIYPGQSWTALECAIARGHTSIVTYLLNVSRNVIDLRSDKKESLLHFAIMQGSLNQSLNGIVQAILDHGAEINSRSSEGQTPLHYAIIKNKNGSLLPVLRSLLEGGADVNAQDVYGFTPLTWAKKTNNSIAAEVLTRQGALASLEESLITTIETGTPAVLGDLITKGVNITVLKYDNSSNFHDSTGLTALQVAIKRYCTAGEMDSPAQLESLEIFEAILASDIDRNVCGPKGTALHTACTWASMSTHLVKALLEKVSTMLILFTRG
jgi:ankyrin repeat protein